MLHPIGADRREQNQSLGGGASERPDPRQAAAEAAEQRMKAVRGLRQQTSYPLIHASML